MRRDDVDGEVAAGAATRQSQLRRACRDAGAAAAVRAALRATRSRARSQRGILGKPRDLREARSSNANDRSRLLTCQTHERAPGAHARSVSSVQCKPAGAENEPPASGGACPEASISAAVEAARAKFHLWYHLLVLGGFSVLLHGEGSKFAVLEAFAADLVKRNAVDAPNIASAVLVVNGFNPFVQVRALVQEIADAAGARRLSPHSRKHEHEHEPHARRGRPLAAQLRMLGELYKAEAPRRLFLVVHNIDGQTLSTTATQTLLANLASQPRVHLIASIDRMEVTLLWPVGSCYERFQWIWQHCPTHLPHVVETGGHAESAKTLSAEQLVRGAIMLLTGLTPNARRIFQLLAQMQLESAASAEDRTRGERVKQGISFSDFYRICRSKFFVSNANSLQAILRELEDHNLLESAVPGWRTGASGLENSRSIPDCLRIPLPSAQIREVLRELHADPHR
jgi:origin recognition complex subunit 2